MSRLVHSSEASLYVSLLCHITYTCGMAIHQNVFGINFMAHRTCSMGKAAESRSSRQEKLKQNRMTLSVSSSPKHCRESQAGPRLTPVVTSSHLSCSFALCCRNVQNRLTPDVGGKDDYAVAKVYHVSLTVGNPSIVEKLQHDVKHVWVSFLPAGRKGVEA